MFRYYRTVYLADTDAAGVVYFARVMQMCHEAYEESLAASGIYLQEYLAAGKVAMPIVHADIDFFSPLVCGDRLLINLTATLIKPSEFAITYQLHNLSNPEKTVVKANTQHVGINPQSRNRVDLPEAIRQWIAMTNYQ